MIKALKIVTLAGALLLAAAPSHAMTYYLSEQWLSSNGSRMCRYGNGTILNVGYRMCPMSIQG